MQKFPKSLKICQILQKSQFSYGSKSKKFILILKSWLTIICKVNMVLFTLGAEDAINFNKVEIVG